jgi:hypothetical protein
MFIDISQSQSKHEFYLVVIILSQLIFGSKIEEQLAFSQIFINESHSIRDPTSLLHLNSSPSYYLNSPFPFV